MTTILTQGDSGLKVLAFIYPHEGICYQCSNCDHTPYLTSVDIIEVLTGLSFNIEENVEKIVQVKVRE